MLSVVFFHVEHRLVGTCLLFFFFFALYFCFFLRGTTLKEELTCFFFGRLKKFACFTKMQCQTLYADMQLPAKNNAGSRPSNFPPKNSGSGNATFSVLAAYWLVT